MRLELRSVDDAQEAAMVAAELIQRCRPRVFGAATGATPELLYRELVDRCLLDPWTTVCLLDEYIGLPTGHPQRYRQVIEGQLGAPLGLRVVSPDVDADDLEAACAAYEVQLDELGGVDLQVLGLGRNGHIAFNEPGSEFDSRTRVVELAATTRADNARFFGREDATPTHAITQGVATLRRARQVVLIATGSAKARAVAAMLDGPITTKVPATALREHECVTVIADRDALSIRAERDHGAPCPS